MSRPESLYTITESYKNLSFTYENQGKFNAQEIVFVVLFSSWIFHEDSERCSNLNLHASSGKKLVITLTIYIYCFQSSYTYFLRVKPFLLSHLRTADLNLTELEESPMCKAKCSLSFYSAVRCNFDIVVFRLCRRNVVEFTVSIRYSLR